MNRSHIPLCLASRLVFLNYASLGESTALKKNWMSLLLSTRFPLLFLLMIWSSSLSFAQQPSKEALAEKAADKIVKRFYETLDFGVIYRELYVKDEKLRRAEVAIVASNLLFQGEFSKLSKREQYQVDFEAMERAYLAQGNFHWVLAAATWTNSDTEKLGATFKYAWKKHYEPLMKTKNFPMRTNKEVDEVLLPGFNGMAASFRGLVVKENFGSAEYNRKESAFKEDAEPDSLETLKELFADAGVKQTDFWYIARRGRFYIYLVEEDGEFRMLSFKDRVRF